MSRSLHNRTSSLDNLTTSKMLLQGALTCAVGDTCVLLQQQRRLNALKSDIHMQVACEVNNTQYHFSRTGATSLMWLWVLMADLFACSAVSLA